MVAIYTISQNTASEQLLMASFTENRRAIASTVSL
jgi:hypothetical protein